MTYHLAIDIGASSGRHILGYCENGRLKLEEVHRFEDYLKQEDGALTWDIEKLVSEVKAGIKKCGELGKIPATIAIDTWGVDYVLLDENKKELLPAFAYRDGRTAAVPEEIDGLIPPQELYARTGIQKQFFNTIYQLYCDKKNGRLAQAKHFLMIPDYLAYRLTGEIKNEYTIASTTGLLGAKAKTWDTEILDRLGIKKEIFSELSLPCTEVGDLRGFDFESKVISAPSHDTASAVAACATGDNGVYISSGTWSLIGTENTAPVLSDAAMAANFTNEGGIDYRYRFLKNIMGMWLFQNVRRNLNKRYSYDDMMRLAMNARSFEVIDTNAPEFVAPDNMIDAIRAYLHKPTLALDITINTIYHSLANSYAKAVKEIEQISGKKIEVINIVGGGSKDRYLNELTAKYTGKRVLTGPVEATATGNLISQMMYCDPELSLEKARELVKASFDIQEIK